VYGIQQPQCHHFILRGLLLVIYGSCEGEQPGGYSESKTMGTSTVQGDMLRHRAGRVQWGGGHDDWIQSANVGPRLPQRLEGHAGGGGSSTTSRKGQA